MLGLHGALSLLGAGIRGKPRRGMLRRAVFSDFQRKGLEKVFQKQKYISKPDRKKLAEKLGLKDSQVCINAFYFFSFLLHTFISYFWTLEGISKATLVVVLAVVVISSLRVEKSIRLSFLVRSRAQLC